MKALATILGVFGRGFGGEQDPDISDEVGLGIWGLQVGGG